MPISHEKRIVFVHIPKTGGTSIELALDMNKNENLFSPGIKFNTYKIEQLKKYKVSPQHLYGKEILEVEPNVKDYYWFTVVRNPFDRLVSEYHHINKERTNDFVYKNISFPEFVKKTLTLPEERRKSLFDRHLEPQTNFIQGCSVNIYKLEKLQECFDFLKTNYQISTIGHARKSERKKFQVYYDGKLANFVFKFYIKDFEKFGYKKTI
jgi:hypothetical protein